MCFILLCVCAQSLSCVRFFVIPWTAAHQAPLSMGFSKNPGVGCHFLLQRIFPAQGLNPCLVRLLYWQVVSLSLNHRGSTHNTHRGSITPRLISIFRYHAVSFSISTQFLNFFSIVFHSLFSVCQILHMDSIYPPFLCFVLRTPAGMHT